MTDAASDRAPLLKRAFLLALLLGLGFGAHAAWVVFTRFEAPRVEDWMTPRHVMQVFDLPRDDLAPVLGLQDDTPFRTLRDLAADRGVAADALVAQVQALVDRAEAGE